MIVTLQRSATADAETLLALQIAAFHDDARLYPGVELGGPPGYDSLDVLLDRIEGNDYYTILADGQIVGGIMAFPKGEGHRHLDVIYIAPDFHGRGIGSQAMRFIEQAYPAALWTLDTPVYAIRNHHFYEKLGYVRMARFEDDGFALYAYEKRT